MSFNLNVQKGLGKNAVLQIGYVGTLGRRLLSLRDINQAALGSGFNNSQVVTPGGNVFSFQQASRPYFSQFPNFGVIDEIQGIGTSSYNGLQTTLRTTSWHGLVSQFNYTYAHSLDEVTQYVGALPQDSTKFYGDYGNSDYDIRHHFNSYLIYDIPASSHGPQWLTHGWEANGNLSFRTGEPFSIHASSGTSGTGENTERGVQVVLRSVECRTLSPIISRCNGSIPQPMSMRPTEASARLRGTPSWVLDMGMWIFPSSKTPPFTNRSGRSSGRRFSTSSIAPTWPLRGIHRRWFRPEQRHHRGLQWLTGHWTWRAVQCSAGVEDSVLRVSLL